MVELELQEFEKLARQTLLGERSLQAARMVLVEGMRQSDVCRETGILAQQLSRALKVLEREATENPLVVSRALAVKQLRDLKGDDAVVKTPRANELTVGRIVLKTDHHLVQAIGKDHYMLHQLSCLERVPAVGKRVELRYRDGMASIVESGRELDRSREGRHR